MTVLEYASSMRGLAALLISFSCWASAAPLEFAILADAGAWNANSKALLASIFKTSVRDLILPGDNLYLTKKSYTETWGHWKEKGFRFPVVAIGNHSKGYVAEKGYFQIPDENYVYRAGPETIFLVVNSDNQFWEKSQVSWLERELSKAKSEFIFIVYHHPTYDVVGNGHRWTDRKEFQQLIRPVLTKYRSKITAVINGHDHVAALLRFDDLPVIISGATQNPTSRSQVNNTQFGVVVKTDFFGQPVPQWAHLTIDEEKKSALIRFIRAEDNVTVYESCLITGKPSVQGSCDHKAE